MQDLDRLFTESVYAFPSERSILEEKDLGICADVASVCTPEYSVAALECFQGCPYTNTAFRFDLRIDGERVRTERWDWLPMAMRRQGHSAAFTVETLTAVLPGTRAFVLRVVCRNTTGRALRVPLQVTYRSACRYEEHWDFCIPTAGKGSLADYTQQGELLGALREGAGLWLTSSVPGLRIFPSAYLWEGEIDLPADGSCTFWFSGHMGTAEGALAETGAVGGNYEALLAGSLAYYEACCARIDARLPRFSSEEPALDALYHRSLVAYFLCRWDNPDLCSQPYFSTGSINGGCMCSYLWNYCGGLMLHPLFDEAGSRQTLLTYLKNDLTTSYAILPVTGGKNGPWYPVNQEKIICMVYYHVLFTGDKAFLQEQAGERTVLEWMRYHAYICDDVTAPVALYDYGVKGDSHLELRRSYRYNGVMPDLNARRYLNYTRVYELTALAGQPDRLLLERAQALKPALKTLWNEEAQWYDFINAQGERDIRYTVQMFKFLNSPVLGETERQGLIAHLNDREFLSKFGLHSMSKLDPAYDQDDIDNGGGGICPHFTMQICAQLYEIGQEALATDILRRVLWWGSRLPYLGDSVAANLVGNREDTPLQGDISAVGCAQMIFFSLFGIRADFSGCITVCPVRERPARRMQAENARLCGKVFSVLVEEDSFTVTCGGRTQRAKIGETVTV